MARVYRQRMSLSLIQQTSSLIQHKISKVLLENENLKKKKMTPKEIVYIEHFAYILYIFCPSFAFHKCIFALCLKDMFYYLEKIKQLTFADTFQFFF